MPKKGYKFTEEHRENLIKNHKGMLGKKPSEETKRKISLAQKGKPRWIDRPHPKGMLGKTPWNKDKKTGIVPKSAFKKGELHIFYKKRKEFSCKECGGIIKSLRLRSFCSRKCVGVANGRKSKGKKGHSMSEENKIKLSFRMKGKASHMKGKKWSEEWKKTQSIRIKNAYKNGKKLGFQKEHPVYVSNKTTSIEVILQNFLKEQGIPFEANYPMLGHPDIFIKPNICIFADGCYWHKCKECGFGESIRKEREKDQRITRELQTQGYIVIRLWEHTIKNMADISELNLSPN